MPNPPLQGNGPPNHQYFVSRWKLAGVWGMWGWMCNCVCVRVTSVDGEPESLWAKRFWDREFKYDLFYTPLPQPQRQCLGYTYVISLLLTWWKRYRETQKVGDRGPLSIQSSLLSRLYFHKCRGLFVLLTEEWCSELECRKRYRSFSSYLINP